MIIYVSYKRRRRRWFVFLFFSFAPPLAQNRSFLLLLRRVFPSSLSARLPIFFFIAVARTSRLFCRRFRPGRRFVIKARL